MRFAILAIAVAGCVSERGPAAARPTTFWIGEVDALVAEACGGCHGGDAPAGGYDLSSYLGALAPDRDGAPRAIAGDPASRIIAVLTADDPIHADVVAAAPALRAWVVDARLAYRDSDVHAPGLMNPADPDFHAALLARRGWDLDGCAGCHGADYAGGASEATCLGCHAEGPTACATCHGDGPTTGAHAAHRGGLLDRPTACAACHVVPERWDAEGHLTREGVADPPPAEVVLGAAAARDVEPPRRTAPPAYDPTTGTCAGVYCHGGILGDAAATRPAPRWDDGPDAAACGACHGAPPADHVGAPCATCHPTAIARDGVLRAAHLDGVLDVGDGSRGCAACHGDATSPAPPRALDGATRPDALGVGAHRAHLEGWSRLSDPIACGECHATPVALDDPGHLDDDAIAEVFPGGGGPLAGADGAAPAWDRSAGRCAATYCHGGGDALAADGADGRVVAPRWTAVGEGEAACGRCHGLPPEDGVHPDATVAECTTCHPTVDGFGNILFTGPAGARHTGHLDGTVDLR